MFLCFVAWQKHDGCLVEPAHETDVQVSLLWRVGCKEFKVLSCIQKDHILTLELRLVTDENKTEKAFYHGHFLTSWNGLNRNPPPAGGLCLSNWLGKYQHGVRLRLIVINQSNTDNMCEQRHIMSDRLHEHASSYIGSTEGKQNLHWFSIQPRTLFIALSHHDIDLCSRY